MYNVEILLGFLFQFCLLLFCIWLEEKFINSSV